MITCSVRGDRPDVSANTKSLLVGATQCSRSSRYIGQVTPEVNFFYHKNKLFFGCKYPENILINFENKITCATMAVGISIVFTIKSSISWIL